MNIILLRAIVLAVVATALNGCGTIATLSMDEKDIAPPCKTLPRAYSGTVFDYHMFYHPETVGTNNVEFIFFIDLPLSLVMDTIVLPYTGYKQIQYGSYGSECEKNAGDL